MNRFTASATTLLVALVVAPAFAFASTDFSPTPRTDFYLSKAGSPYVIEGDAYVDQWSSIVVEAGVVFKFKTATSSLEIHGAAPITNQATADEPIYFTSYADDTHGGDTNGDGAASIPTVGDWGNVTFGCGTTFNYDRTRLSYMRVLYGGSEESAVALPGPVPGELEYHPASLFVCLKRPGIGTSDSLKVDGVVVAHGHAGILLQATNNYVTLENSSIYDNEHYGLKRAPAWTNGRDLARDIVAENNWWGDASGPYHADENPDGLGNAIASSESPYPFSFNPWLSGDPLPEPITGCQEQCYSSLLFLPGFEGSKLMQGSNTLWPPSIGVVQQDLGTLVLDSGGDSQPGIVVDGILNTFDIGPISIPVYREFSTFAEGLVADGVIEEWRAFPYDWRYSVNDVVTNGVETPNGHVDLIETVENMAAQSRSGKVAIVGHSMGGLLGKALIKELETQGKEDLVDSFVMVGTPQLGTPQAIGGLLHGEQAEIGRSIFTFVNRAQARALGMSLQSAFDLLPSQRYFTLGTPAPVLFGPVDATELWRSLWGESLGTYASLYEFLSGKVASLSVRSGAAYSDTQNPVVLDESKLANSAALHNELDTYSIPNAIRTLQIVGWGLETIKGIEYTEDDGELDYEPLFTTEGDGTVVYPSANASGNITYYLDMFLIGEVEDTTYTHSDLMRISSVQKLIEQSVTEESLGAIYLSTERPTLRPDMDALIVSAHSPVTLGVYDALGRYSGVSTTTSTSELQIFTTDIPGSRYLPFGEGKYLIVPKGGSYSFVLQGTGEGTATVRVETLASDQKTKVAEYADIPVSTESKITLQTTPENLDNNLEVDANGDGEVDGVVFPNGDTPDVEEIFSKLEQLVQGFDFDSRRDERKARVLLKKIEVQLKVYTKLAEPKKGIFKALKKILDRKSKITERQIQRTKSSLDDFSEFIADQDSISGEEYLSVHRLLITLKSAL